MLRVPEAGVEPAQYETSGLQADTARRVRNSGAGDATGTAGFEPAASRLTSERSAPLSYVPT